MQIIANINQFPENGMRDLPMRYGYKVPQAQNVGRKHQYRNNPDSVPSGTGFCVDLGSFFYPHFIPAGILANLQEEFQ
jgi:hypothetical protein